MCTNEDRYILVCHVWLNYNQVYLLCMLLCEGFVNICSVKILVPKCTTLCPLPWEPNLEIKYILYCINIQVTLSTHCHIFFIVSIGYLYSSQLKFILTLSFTCGNKFFLRQWVFKKGIRKSFIHSWIMRHIHGIKCKSMAIVRICKIFNTNDVIFRLKTSFNSQKFNIILIISLLFLRRQ